MLHIKYKKIYLKKGLHPGNCPFYYCVLFSYLLGITGLLLFLDIFRILLVGKLWQRLGWCWKENLVIQYYTKYFLNIFTGTIEDSQHYREAQFITIWYLPINSLKWLSLQEWVNMLHSRQRLLHLLLIRVLDTFSILPTHCQHMYILCYRPPRYLQYSISLS
jgi:hypothetical protein